MLFAGLLASGLTMFGALKMMRLEGYGAAVMASILGMIVTPGNLVGLPVGIWALVVLSSRSVKAAFAANRPPALSVKSDSPQPAPASARFSRVAVAGAVWAPFFLFVAVSTVVVVPVRVEAGAEPPGPAWWQIALAVTMLPLGLTAPLGTTICGAVSLAQIRHSAGRLYGLGLAVFDLLLYPLLVLDVAIGFVVFAVMQHIASSSGGEHGQVILLLPMLGITFLICAVVDTLIFWLVWRAAKPKPQDPIPSRF